MEMQNVTDLTIPEGNVRTIHDSTSRLIWGRLNYDTKYAGDTYQHTYSGKNIIDFATISYSAANSGSGTRNGATFTVNGASDGNYGGIQFIQSNLQLKTDTTYTFSATVVSTTNTNGSMVYANSAMSSTSSQIFGNNAKAGERTTVTFTTPSSITNSASIRLYPATADATAVFTDIMVEESATATYYEPYVGGIPAPNPDYPQNMQTVTGEQTVSISDGNGNTQSYTISLGSIELCKIGNYEDYIYKSGDDWYVHKEVGKYTFAGNEDWRAGAYGVNSWTLDNVIITSFDTTKTQVISNLFRGVPHDDRNIAGDNTIYFGSNIRLWIRNTSLVTLTNVQSATNGNYVYYVLATATDTKITDATLILQLNAVHEWLTRYGYSSTVIGELPIIIEQTNL